MLRHIVRESYQIHETVIICSVVCYVATHCVELRIMALMYSGWWHNIYHDAARHLFSLQPDVLYCIQLCYTRLQHYTFRNASLNHTSAPHFSIHNYTTQHDETCWSTEADNTLKPTIVHFMRIIYTTLHYVAVCRMGHHCTTVR